MCSGALVALSRGRASTSHRDLCRLSCAVRAGGKAICCNDAMSATTPFFGTNSRRAARADRESVARLDALLETIVDQQEALLVRMLRGCAQGVVDAPLAQELALREDLARMQLDVMKQCSALFDVLRPRPRSRAGSIIPERFSASQAASSKRQEEAKREQDDDEHLKAAELLWRVAKAADNTAAVDAVLKAWRASKDVVAAKLAKPEEKKELRRKRDRLVGDAQAARRPRQRNSRSGGAQFSLRRRIMVPSCRRP